MFDNGFAQNGYQTAPFGGYNVFGGYPAQQAPQPVVFNQLLTADQMQQLQKSPQTFNTKLTQDEYLRAICTHKNLQNQITLEPVGNGRFRCSVCQAEFYMWDTNTSMDEIKQICDNFHDLLQTIKTYYGNVPPNLADFYLMIGFIKKVPMLWTVAKNYFEKVTSQTGYNQQDATQNGFAMMGNVFGNSSWGAMGNNGYYQQQPMMAPPMAQAQMPQPGFQGYGQPQPIQNPMGQPQQPQNPAFGVMQQPNQTPQYGFNQGYAQQPSANPIGYVDPTAQQAPMPTPPSPAPAPAPQNPNMTSPVQPAADNKANVEKKFK